MTIRCMFCSHFTGQCGNAMVKARQSSLSVCVWGGVGGGRGVVHCMVTSLVNGNAVVKAAQSRQWWLGGLLFTGQCGNAMAKATQSVSS